MTKNIIAVYGGNSTEHDISVITAVQALAAMPSKGLRVFPVYIKEGIWYTGEGLYKLSSYAPFDPQKYTRVMVAGGALFACGRKGKIKTLAEKIDCAVCLTHGGTGENGALQGFFELNGIPYTSAGVAESALCMDKLLTKYAARSAGIPVLKCINVKKGTKLDIARIEEEFGYPVVVKPRSQGSSIGVSFAENADELAAAIDLALEFDDNAVIERGLTDMTEINSAAVRIGGKLTLSELERPLAARDVLTFEDKYGSGEKSGMGSGRREFPADIPDFLRERILGYTARLYEEMNLSGVVRADYMICGKKVYLNEINSIPGSLANYLFPGLSYTELLRGMMDDAIGRGVKKEAVYKTDVLSKARLGIKIK